MKTVNIDFSTYKPVTAINFSDVLKNPSGYVGEILNNVADFKLEDSLNIIWNIELLIFSEVRSQCTAIKWNS